MSDIAIRVNGLGKQYRIGGQQQGRSKYRTIRESLVDAVQAPFRRAAKLLRGQPYGASEMDETIWALKDVSFEVKCGEVVGVIGPNGAGKTTLLKILSRITKPTRGWAEVHGRVGSLLEVGTGFHPELTGRENIYLNGAVLGMKRAEIEGKFDEIVAFSELEKFVDTPVKHYSSGMYVRLAFAVAAHLEPEILLVDEVLAVGDAAFRKKCLAKMGAVAGQGRTVLFVSHNMGAIQGLTERCLLLKEGQLVLDRDSMTVVEKYLENLSSSSNRSRAFETDIPGLRVDGVKLNQEQMSYGFNEPLRFDVCLEAEQDVVPLTIGLQIFNSKGSRLITSKLEIPELEAGRSLVSVRVEDHHLPPGEYRLSIWVRAFYRLGSLLKDVLLFEISDVGIDDPFLTRRRDSLGVYLPVEHRVCPADELTSHDGSLALS